MKQLKQLHLVARVEKDREHKFAMQFQQARQYLLDCQKKLSGLENYRLDYMRNIKQKATQGLGANTINQHHQFVGKLDKACEQQIQIINQAVLVADQRKQQWLAQQKKAQAISILIESKEKEIHQHEIRLEQKLSDEFALQAMYRNQRTR